MAESLPRRRLDRRLFILPLVALATATAVLVPTELVLRARYPDQPVDRCIDQTVEPLHGKAGCTTYVKAAEGPWVENRYNECGYRSPFSCGPVPAGALRVAVIGSSMGAGTFVPEPQSVSGRLTTDLQAACGRTIQSQNLAVPALPVTKIAVSAREALALKPDILIITITSFDLKTLPGGPVKSTKPFIKTITESAQKSLKSFALYYTAKRLFLSSEKDYIGFIGGQHRTDRDIIGEIGPGVSVLAQQIDATLAAERDRRVPIALAFMPNREEVARTRLQPGHREPVSVALQKLAKERGISFIDGLRAFPGNVTTASLYYVENGHLNATGDDYIARALTRGLVDSVPVFAGCRHNWQ
jgi:hypothetical protein